VLLFEISKPNNNYIVLESYISEASGSQNLPLAQPDQSQSWQKTLHVINFNKDEFTNEELKQVSIGRGTDNDLRLTDISVSRVHAFIKKSADGDYYLTDNDSKFGTLI
jgi:pSer/pThr/pTyr-binding forkhead associated (FHA) protein